MPSKFADKKKYKTGKQKGICPKPYSKDPAKNAVSAPSRVSNLSLKAVPAMQKESIPAINQSTGASLFYCGWYLMKISKKVN
jgi:hypothetical protein